MDIKLVIKYHLDTICHSCKNTAMTSIANTGKKNIMEATLVILTFCTLARRFALVQVMSAIPPMTTPLMSVMIISVNDNVFNK